METEQVYRARFTALVERNNFAHDLYDQELLK